MRERLVAITGASGNLGHATASLLLDGGASALLFDRSANHAAKFKDAVDSGRGWFYAVDLTSEAETRAALADGVAKSGKKLEGLVCTVGGYRGGAPLETSGWDDWDAMWSINVRTTVTCVRAALPMMLEHGRGSIVLVASLAGLSGGAGEAAYSACKAAVLRLTESLAAEVKGRGVRVNAIMPGTLDTPQNRAWMSPEQIATAIEPRAVGDVIAFLLSDASRAMTGAALKVSGRQ
ncbi:MAG: SDR family NAD(P)-dependent oxidoreductase [Polyangiaceae bacterium]